MKRKSASKRRPSWIEKLDAAGQQFVLGYRLTKQFDRKCSNPTERHKFVNLVRSYLPGFVPKEETDIPPAALDSLKSVGFPVWTNVTAGKQLLPVSVGRFISNVGILNEIMDAPEFRKLFPTVGAFVLLMFRNFYEEIALQNFGTMDLSADQVTWTIGTVFIAVGYLLRRERFDLGKGRANAELLEVLRMIRSHQTKKIMPKEMKNILEYLGIHVPDAESLRIFEWRAKRKGQL